MGQKKFVNLINPGNIISSAVKGQHKVAVKKQKSESRLDQALSLTLLIWKRDNDCFSSFFHSFFEFQSSSKRKTEPLSAF